MLNQEFIKNLNEEFDNELVKVVGIQISVIDKNDINKPPKDIITLSFRNTEDIILNTPVVDFMISENYDKIKNVINRTGSDDNEY